MTDLKDMLPLERMEYFGPEALTDEELLAVFLRCGSKGENIFSLCHRLLSIDGEPGRLINLHRFSYSELKDTKGIGPVKASQIIALTEMVKRVSGQQRQNRLLFNNPCTVADFYMERLRHLEKERVLLLLLDNRCSLIKEIVLSQGTVISSPISIREIFVEACRYKAERILLIHNHPSGDPNPSNEDLQITQMIREASKVMGIPLLDHLIIGDNRYYSLKEHNK